ncbi:SpoIIE family protein phosphatase [Cellulomonas fimi]|uniref:Putative PAS/PAC sensor protein n=1 Tax=Cellulomonas fimi (strain ATCC 484 / DSM 20113 / JCM 1341 / CCUG 24087 / LMG 16345 / NBRC 15513 / NCIMB 8980 / NCTC 7547 / NRS-133) TaxID=590998 RepID=F4H001_CELFA|nr:SpoIIE family protein phosphatase [Cellulomonas fimi]AEE44923.1 putative PAS/PAC sensor protein [Cellulomonas fimi ATCC 484]NNH07254.1 SpoIIE family protein phosphatase [Cellulomonas fimi]VEH27692.1 Phytochrome-like protein cph1 [Cellulomonas fimi]
MTEATFLAPGEPVDLDNCAREPIHVPGSVQPRGVLLAVSEPDLVVAHVSENVAHLLGVAVEDALGRPLDATVGARSAAAVRQHVAAWGSLRERNPLQLLVPTPGGDLEVDAVLHRVVSGDTTLLVIELEPATGPRPFSFPNTYQAVRGVVEQLNRAHELTEMYDITAREVRALTGFDRVMVYRFDAEYNGEVVAEARRDDLNAFLGLHYPASDIPPQARALYEKNWVRLISDVAYTPARIVPGIDGRTGLPLDLTHAVLRSVSPIHCEYLGNMGVAASMSISLLRDGRLWGLIACHHYAGPFEPPYGVRAAAEFLGSTLSLRLVARVEEDELADRLASAEVLGRLVENARDEDRPLAQALLDPPSLLDLVPADGAVAQVDGAVLTAGDVPRGVGALLTWVAEQPDDVVVRTALADEEPDLARHVPEVAGVLALRLPDGQSAVWLRREQVHHVDWGGDPHNKAIARREGGTVRLSPRLSFELWRETVRGRSAPWEDRHVRTATELRARLLEVLVLRSRTRLRAAQTVQRSLLPASLPVLDGWSVDARYEPAAGGRVGGDWYDALLLPDGRLAVVVGDVAGHGLEAAAAMGQLRNALRAYLLRGDGPAQVLRGLDHVARWTMPFEMATVVVAVVDPVTGDADVAVAGHPRPVVLHADGRAELVQLPVDRPVGVGSGDPPAGRLHVPAGGALVLYSDGLVDSRATRLRDGLARLRAAVDRTDDPARPLRIDDVLDACREEGSVDDLTLLVLCRDAA